MPRPPAPLALGSPRWFVAALCAFAAFGCAFGLWGMWPWLVTQADRVGPAAVAEFWVSDAVAVFWFLWAVTSVLVHGGGRVADDVALRRRRVVVLSMALAVLLRLGFTVALWRGEKSAYARGAVTTASVVAVRRGDAPYILDCRFTDEAGRPVRSDIRVFEYKDEPIPPALGVQRRAQLRSKPRPFPIAVRYDRARPQRCWVEGAGIAHANDLLPFSLIVILFEALLVPLVWDCMRPGHRAFRVTTDYELYRLAPLAIEACLLCFFGLLAGLGRLVAIT